jgi:hypothetical protein
MKQLVGTLHRGEKTNNWNTQKTHEILHFAEQIREYGSLMNADTGVGERGLKYSAKEPACNARKGSIDVFTESTTNQVCNTMILKKASDVMNVGDHMFTCTRSHTRSNFHDNDDMGIKTGSLVGAPKYKIVVFSGW